MRSRVLPVLIIGLSLLPPSQMSAQTFATLHSFTAPSLNLTNGDGANPIAGLILAGDTLYGTAFHGGTNGYGTVFALNANNTSFTSLYSFSNGSDGANPFAGLVLSGNTLYGTAIGGGSAGYGTVFAISTNGTNFATLYSFTNGSDGANPYAGLIVSGNALYGTTTGGGIADNGTVFTVNTNGANFITLYSFTNGSDGSHPAGGLILSGDTLYGTAQDGGSSGKGTVFAVNTNGTNFMTLYSFTNGSAPHAGLILAASTLYGTTALGGSSGNGTVFAINTNGSNFTTLYSFTNGNDGADPWAGLILSGNTLYGTAQNGGSSGTYGTVFAVNTDGTDFTTLHSFDIGPVGDGAYPFAGLVLSDNTLYGTTSYGGKSAGGPFGYGMVFSLSFTPQLTINLSGANIVLTWPTNVAGFDYSGFTLQSTTNLSNAAWCTNLPAPVVINGHYTVTNPTSDTQQFFRLSQ